MEPKYNIGDVVRLTKECAVILRKAEFHKDKKDPVLLIGVVQNVEKRTAFIFYDLLWIWQDYKTKTGGYQRDEYAYDSWNNFNWAERELEFADAIGGKSILLLLV